MVVGLMDMLLFRLTKEKIQWRTDERLCIIKLAEESAARGSPLLVLHYSFGGALVSHRAVGLLASRIDSQPVVALSDVYNCKPRLVGLSNLIALFR